MPPPTPHLLHPTPGRSSDVLCPPSSPCQPSPAVSIPCACARVCHKRCTNPQSLSEFSPMPSPAVVPGSVGGSTPPWPEVSAAGGGGGAGWSCHEITGPQTMFGWSDRCRKVMSFSLGDVSS